MNSLFVYGIFLNQAARDRYGMYAAAYATVQDYATKGSYIVQACEATGLCLTGLTVKVDPRYWSHLDQLETGYDRVLIETTDDELAYMYVERQDKLENFNPESRRDDERNESDESNNDEDRHSDVTKEQTSIASKQEQA